MNATLPDSEHASESEIAMPGGVRPENIKGWQEVDSKTGKLGPFEANPYYRPSSGTAGPRHREDDIHDRPAP